jgi:hypothetical protein
VVALHAYLGWGRSFVERAPPDQAADYDWQPPMTLALCIVSSHGIWQSADMRLFDVAAGKPISDLSTKQWAAKTADGIAAIAYAGIGRLANGDHVSDLMVRHLRGESRTISDTVLAIRGFANSLLAPVAWKEQWQHTFIVGAFLDDKPWAATIGNIELVRLGYPKLGTRLRRSFEVNAAPVGPEGLVLVAGQRNGLRDEDTTKLMRARRNRPAQFGNYLDLLGSITRRVAHRLPKVVSEHAHALYVPPPSTRPQGPLYDLRTFEWGTPVPAISRPATLLFGIDLGVMMRRLVEAMPGTPAWSANADLGMREAVQLEPGVPVRDRASAARGTVVSDPAPGMGENKVAVRWDAHPREVTVVEKEDLEALYPGHP